MRKLLVSIAALAFSSRAEAQGALSLQGLGYPTGGVSARGEATGGGLADFDPLSLVNPASLAAGGASSLFLQYSPEFRRVSAGSNTAKTTTARFPLISGALSMGQAWTLGLGASTFLDRSSETSLVRQMQVGGPTDLVNVTERNKVLGAINDVRLGLAWAATPGFHIGVGAHVFAGSNRITFSRLFPDSTRYLSTAEAGRISFAGFAGSLGVEYRPSRVVGFALAGRKGGNLSAQSGDTTFASGKIPDHYSGSITYEGITGAVISARVAHDGWSSLSSLSSSNTKAFDGWDTGAGVEFTGPSVMQRVVTLRAGARVRTLPFGLNGEKVTETSFAGGLGLPLARNRASFDFSVQRASRTAGSDVKERAFILSFGLRVTP